MGGKSSSGIVKYFTACYFFPALVIFFLSCASSSGVYKNIDNAVYQNDFERGINEIIKGQEKKRPIYPGKNAVSLFLDKGILEHYAGNYRNSSLDLENAERLIQEAFTKSITAGVASYIANDNMKEYPGEDYEDIYLNVFNALNYYHNNNTEEAMVEIRKITMSNGKLDLLSKKYEEGNKFAAQYLLESLHSIGFMSAIELPMGEPVLFSDSALARFLSALFYQGQGKEDDARIEFEQLHTAFTGNPKVYYHPVPKSAGDAQNIPQGKARLNVIAFAGLSPIKEEKAYNQFFPFFNNPALRYPQFKLPVLAKRPSVIDRIQVGINGQKSFDLELIEDMGAVARETYNARFANMFFKTYIRTIIKYAAAEAGANAAASKYASENENEKAAGLLIGLATSIAGKVAADSSEAADIRMGRYFPDKAYIGGINLDPGIYSVTVTFYNQGRIIAADDFTGVNVRANTLNLIEATSLR
jgi:hypothetical protein